ncbi:MAG TPA: zf-HC2 domain-containing protein [Bryobacteraceae bacterium]|jgi:predicted anti-sigma-YlaC factor YlaD|nr:zf-HC2 domain-containing protein [Bryobacteraceae bacterium]
MKEASGHVANDVLIRFLDEEMSPVEANLVEAHLTVCEECKARYREFGAVSVRVEALVSSVPVSIADGERDVLARQLHLSKKIKSPRGWTRFASGAGWSLAAAAGLVLALLFLPGRHGTTMSRMPGIIDAGRPQTFQVSGETFVALPYSNAEIPVSAPHIVEMQVPVSSLSEAGVIFEPVSLEQANPDRAVLADVLFGVDGEPLGVHVIGE